ncbi:MAG TPA: hypothetical protein VGS28_01430 [Candidatus Saccharimonadales bacterium]|nr:hypothetical protein [Candidatus Saccharimonadales bacterium]
MSEAYELVPVIPIHVRDLRAQIRREGLYNEQVRRAIRQARRSSRRQPRDSGNDYFEEHVANAAKAVMQFMRGRDLAERRLGLVGTLLHDTIEDDPRFTYEKCCRRFGQQVADVVNRVTKRGTTDADKAAYHQGIAEGSYVEQVIKVVGDSPNNLGCSVHWANTELMRGNLPEGDHPAFLRLQKVTAENRGVYLPIALGLEPGGELAGRRIVDMLALADLAIARINHLRGNGVAGQVPTAV